MPVSPARRGRRYVSNRDESCRMFRSDWLERMSFVAPWIPHVLYLPVITITLWMAAQRTNATAVLLFAGAGFLLWTIVEYGIHRFAFHPPQWIEDDTRRIVGDLRLGQPVIAALPTLRHKFYFLVHGVHHDYPNDSRRLVMPPGVSLPLAVVFFLAFRAAFGDAALGMFAGFVAGYLCYDTVHYLTHNGATRTAIGRFLKRRHYYHHYADSTKGYGVSSPLWDLVFQTASEGPAPHEDAPGHPRDAASPRERAG